MPIICLKVNLSLNKNLENSMLKITVIIVTTGNTRLHLLLQKYTIRIKMWIKVQLL